MERKHDIVVDLKLTVGPLEFGPDAFALKHEGTIRLLESRKIIGRIIATVVDLELALAKDEHPMAVLDQRQATEEFSLLFNYDTIFLYSLDVLEALNISETANSNLLIIEALEILPQYRGGGLGALAMQAVKYALGRGCSVAALKPHPINPLGVASGPRSWHSRMQYDGFPLNGKKAIRKLTQYYAGLGFASVPGTAIMVCDLDNLEDLTQ